MTGGDRRSAPQGLYRLKPASQRLVRPLEDWLVGTGVSPDAVTLAAVPVAALGGVCLALSANVPALLLAVPVVAAARLVLNLLDGLVARRTGRTHPMGEVWNEVGDRLADTLFIGGLAFVPGVDPRIALAAVVGALLASYAGLAVRAAGGRRQFGGVMSKPGRMAALALAAPVAFATGDVGWLVGAAWVIVAGTLVTLVQRVVAGWLELEGPAP
jgi:CDP-diacylglycerol---glycerol-3-phosphate 3-phosphatidyltransferase